MVTRSWWIGHRLWSYYVFTANMKRTVSHRVLPGQSNSFSHRSLYGLSWHYLFDRYTQNSYRSLRNNFRATISVRSTSPQNLMTVRHLSCLRKPYWGFGVVIVHHWYFDNQSLRFIQCQKCWNSFESVHSYQKLFRKSLHYRAECCLNFGQQLVSFKHLTHVSGEQMNMQFLNCHRVQMIKLEPRLSRLDDRQLNLAFGPETSSHRISSHYPFLLLLSAFTSYQDP